MKLRRRVGRRRRRRIRGRGLPAIDQGKIYFGRGIKRRRQVGRGGLTRFLAGLIAKLGEAVGV